MRSPFLPAVAPLAALIATLVRWFVQGSRNLYSALEKRWYVPDPDLGWRVSAAHPVWVGLEVCAIIGAVAAGVIAAGWVIRRRERTRGQRATVLRVATWMIALLPLAVPIAAFASGGAPAGARDSLPPADAVAVETGISGSLPLPAGRYDVVAHAGSSITAHLSAGHEAFDARFSGELRGSWQGDPRDLAKVSTAEVSVAAASVDTGIGERSKHAREAYLEADKYPQITFTLRDLVAARQDGPTQVAFHARGAVALIGKTHAVDVIGTLRQADSPALARLGLTGDVLLLQADLALAIHETALASDAGDFDGDRLPIHVSLVLRRSSR